MVPRGDFPKGTAEARYLDRLLPPRVLWRRVRPGPLVAHPFHLLRSTLRRFPRRYHRVDVPGRGRGARLPTAEKLRRTVAVSEAGGPAARPRLPHRGQKSSLRVSARRRRDARGEDNCVARDRLTLAGVLSLRTSQMRPAAGQTC